MAWTARAKIRLGFWLLALVPVVLSVTAVRTALHLADSSADVAHTHRVIHHIERMISEVKDVEVAQREYILTGSEQYLAPYRAAERNMSQDLDELRRLTADNPRQRMWIEHLATLIPQQFDEMKKTIELRNTEGLEAASQVVLTDRGARAMADISKVMHRMIESEHSQLTQRSGRQRQNFIVTQVLLGLLLLANIAFVFSLFWMVRREEQSIRALNAELEQRVEQRTEALRRSNEDLQQFAYVASHDLKEPLRMVSLYTELLSRRYKGKLDGDADQYIHFAVDGAKRMDKLITDLLSYARAGSEQAPTEAVNTEEILKSVLMNLKATIAAARAEITRDPLPAVVADPVRLTQVLQNLIANAIKYRGDRAPKIHVSAVQNDDESVFSVRDNGIGIDPKYADQIFGIFERLHDQEYEGTGIGLAMCKRIVERHGGRIWVESSPNEGSTFYFTIPRVQPATVAGAA